MVLNIAVVSHLFFVLLFIILLYVAGAGFISMNLFLRNKFYVFFQCVCVATPCDRAFMYLCTATMWMNLTVVHLVIAGFLYMPFVLTMILFWLIILIINDFNFSISGQPDVTIFYISGTLCFIRFMAVALAPCVMLFIILNLFITFFVAIQM